MIKTDIKMADIINEEPLPLDKYYRLWLLLSQTRSALFKARQARVGHYLHPNQATALIAIWAANGQATPAMLARELFLERHTVSELISRMEKKGLVNKNRDEKKRNVVRITITEKGRRIGHQMIQIDFIRQMMSNLTDEQQVQLRTGLTILLKAALNELGIKEGYRI
jgi:DNA-binding MarR family transcriptional regulator